jgi:hypothetical protein
MEHPSSHPLAPLLVISSKPPNQVRSESTFLSPFLSLPFLGQETKVVSEVMFRFVSPFFVVDEGFG